MTPAREPVPTWLLLGVLIALGANTLASVMVRVTVELMRSLTPFAEAVHQYDLTLLPAYRTVAYAGATLSAAATSSGPAMVSSRLRFMGSTSLG